MPTRLHTGPATRAPTMWESQIVVPACHDVSPDRRGEQAVEPKNGSVVRRRQLARQLKLLHERAGLTIEEAAPALDWSASRLSRIENAQQAVDVHWVRSTLDVYQVSGGSDRDLRLHHLLRAWAAADRAVQPRSDQGG